MSVLSDDDDGVSRRNLLLGVVAAFGVGAATADQETGGFVGPVGGGGAESVRASQRLHIKSTEQYRATTESFAVLLWESGGVLDFPDDSSLTFEE